MSDVDNKQLDHMLQQAFEAASKIYKERGFQRRVGFGTRPALVSVDLANAWTRPGNPFTRATRRRWTTRSSPACRSS